MPVATEILNAICQRIKALSDQLGRMCSHGIQILRLNHQHHQHILTLPLWLLLTIRLLPDGVGATPYFGMPSHAMLHGGVYSTESKYEVFDPLNGMPNELVKFPYSYAETQLHFEQISRVRRQGPVVKLFFHPRERIPLCEKLDVEESSDQ